MRPRLLLLFVVAAGSTLSAVAVAGAREPAGVAARIPAIPAFMSASVDRCPIPPADRPAFARAAADSALPLALLTSVAQVESRFDAAATSSVGARGLLQVMPKTAAELELDADEPGSNVLAGARYLSRLLDRFGSSDLALAAYNAGPTAVARAGGAPNGATLEYVANVTGVWRRLHGCG